MNEPFDRSQIRMDRLPEPVVEGTEVCFTVGLPTEWLEMAVNSDEAWNWLAAILGDEMLHGCVQGLHRLRVERGQPGLWRATDPAP